jgi:cellulose synthase/poly-beta-1,6-N-acetylglucosamine synthase-like glycosyltransferase
MEFLPTAQAVSVFMVVLFLAYLTTILVPYAVRKPEPPGDSRGYEWHFFVPCRDERAVIGRTLARLRETFPQGHIWVIDDDSDDGTGEVVAAAVARYERVHLVQRRRPDARLGKGSALNSAYDALDRFLPAQADRERVIVCIVDADAELAPNALDQVSGPSGFADPRVGAVQIAVFMANRGERRMRPDRGRLGNLFARYLVRMQDLEFRTTIAAMQMLRVRTGSVGMGGNGQFTRMSVLDDIGAQYGWPWHDALLEDYELGLRALLSGHQNRYVHDTHVAQEGLTSLRRLINQRTRWSQGNMQCSRYIPQILRSSHLSNSGVVEACYFLTLPFIQLTGVVVWPAVFTAIFEKMAAAVEGSLGGLLSYWWFFALVLLLGITPFGIWGPIYRKKCEPGEPWWKGLVWGIGLWIYVYYMYLAAIRAGARLLLGRTGWVKTQRNAEPLRGPRTRKAMSDVGS